MILGAKGKTAHSERLTWPTKPEGDLQRAAKYLSTEPKVDLILEASKAEEEETSGTKVQSMRAAALAERVFGSLKREASS